MTISNEAVEAAARAIFTHHWGDDMEGRQESIRAIYRDRARAALEAAAPIIRAEALEAAADEMDLPGSYDKGNYSVADAAYDEAEMHATDYLRARAAAEREGKTNGNV